MRSAGEEFEYCLVLLGQSRELMATAREHWCRGDHEGAFALHDEALELQREVLSLQTQLVEQQNRQIFGTVPRRRDASL